MPVPWQGKQPVLDQVAAIGNAIDFKSEAEATMIGSYCIGQIA
jgi:hypothetical protein